MNCRAQPPTRPRACLLLGTILLCAISAVTAGSRLRGRQLAELGLGAGPVAQQQHPDERNGSQEDVAVWGRSFSAAWAPDVTASGIASVAAGYHHVLALTKTGRVIAWGTLRHGETAVPAPIALNASADQPPPRDPVVAVAAGDGHSLALLKSGAVLCWGRNTEGQCNVPAYVSKAGVVAIRAGPTSSLAVTGNGSVIAWGRTGWDTAPLATLTGIVDIAPAYAGRVMVLLANGTLVSWGTDSMVVPPPRTSAQRVVSVAGLNYGFFVALLEDASFAAWGWDSYKEAALPKALKGRTDIEALAAGPYHFAVLHRGGRGITAWGAADAGQLEPPDASFLEQGLVTALAVGARYTAALLGTGEVRIWGELVNPTPLTAQALGPDASVLHISPGGTHTWVLLSNATAVAFGGDKMGQLPPGTPAIHGVAHVTAGVSHSVLVMQSGAVVQYGDSVKPPPAGLTLPPQEGEAVILDISAGYDFTAVLFSNRSLAVWGQDDCGVLADTASVPAEVQGSALAVSAGEGFITALLDGGRAAAWGCADAGEALNVPEALRSPASTETAVVQVSAGGTHALALLKNGAVVCWGDNSSQQCKLPDAVKAGKAVAVAAGGEHSLALMADGHIECWGGDNDGECSQAPRAVMAGRSVLGIAAGAAQSLALLGPAGARAADRPQHHQIDVRAAMEGAAQARARMPSPLPPSPFPPEQPAQQPSTQLLPPPQSQADAVVNDEGNGHDAARTADSEAANQAGRGDDDDADAPLVGPGTGSSSDGEVGGVVSEVVPVWASADKELRGHRWWGQHVLGFVLAAGLLAAAAAGLVWVRAISTARPVLPYSALPAPETKGRQGGGNGDDGSPDGGPDSPGGVASVVRGSSVGAGLSLLGSIDAGGTGASTATSRALTGKFPSTTRQRVAAVASFGGGLQGLQPSVDLDTELGRAVRGGGSVTAETERLLRQIGSADARSMLDQAYAFGGTSGRGGAGLSLGTVQSGVGG